MTGVPPGPPGPPGPGDDSSFRERLAEQRPRLLVIALKRCARNMANALDLVQETLERALRARLDPPPRNLEAWLNTILDNRFIDLCRAERRLPVHDDIDDEDLADLAGGSIPWWMDLDLEALLDAVEQLPAIYRRTYELNAFEHKPYSAIALELDIPENTVATRLRRARMQLKEILSARFGPPEEPGEGR